jgi:hypothetical protein
MVVYIIIGMFANIVMLFTIHLSFFFYLSNWVIKKVNFLLQFENN